MKRERIDLHGLTVIESKIALNHLLDSLPWDITEVLVVHGYHSHILADYIRSDYQHDRIKKLVYSLNPGDTTFLMKTRKEYESNHIAALPDKRKYFLHSERISFSKWKKSDLALARKMWLNRSVSNYISVTGSFTTDEVTAMFNSELANEKKYHVQHWPLFTNDKRHEFIGYCGLGENKGNTRNYEISVAIVPEFWNMGYGFEAVQTVSDYAYSELDANKLIARVHPDNEFAVKIFQKAGYKMTGDEFVEENSKYYPIFELVK